MAESSTGNFMGRGFSARMELSGGNMTGGGALYVG